MTHVLQTLLLQHRMMYRHWI